MPQGNSNAPQANTNPPAKSENKPVGLANTMVEHNFKRDGFWMAEEEDMTPALTIRVDPDPCISDLDDTEAGPQNSELCFTWDGPDNWLCEESGEVEGEEMAAAIITPCKDHNTPHVKLYNSGAIRHISPYKSDFTTYSPLMPPVFLNTANQQRFPAVGTGKLAIQVSNGRGETELILNDALYAPSIGYTLVLLGALDKEGYNAHIRGSYLELDSLCGKHISHIAHTYK